MWITTPDDAIAPVWKLMQNYDISNKIICHFSGSLSSVVFSGRKEKGASACSVHPMYAFSDKFSSYEKLNTVLFTIEGDEYAGQLMKELFESMGNTVYVIDSAMKGRYHMAAVMASNLMIGLYQMSVDILIDVGFDAEGAGKLLEPLVRNNMEKVLAGTPEDALTGPLERGDVKTLKKHMENQTEDEAAVYVALSKKILEIAQRKNPKRNYETIEKMLS